MHKLCLNKYTYISLTNSVFIYFLNFIYLVLERGEERKRGRETTMCACLLHAPYWGPGR